MVDKGLDKIMFCLFRKAANCFTLGLSQCEYCRLKEGGWYDKPREGTAEEKDAAKKAAKAERDS